jgi:cyclopropane-fatty-acyl-phospholipid synthase
VTTARGTTLEFGDGTGAPVAIRFSHASAERALLLDPDLALGETYMDGTLVVEQGSIADFLELVISNVSAMPRNRWVVIVEQLRKIGRRILQWNTVLRARRNASHHYDIDQRIYGLFLDRDMQYSCAYFDTPGMSLEAAQSAKRRHIAAKLHLDRPDLRVLDIGSGWGGLGLHLAREHEASVVGINLAEEQVKVARRRAAQENLRCEFRIQDYRAVTETFDRIVSVGMFEHVGKQYYETFFEDCHRMLDDDGVMLLHTVGRWDGPSDTNPWVWKYIFPGGYAPALSELTPVIERSKFIIADIEVLRLHYAQTLRAWRMNFEAHLAEVLRIFASDPKLTERFGSAERFIRMWEFYLAGFEQFFKYYGLTVFQLQLVKKLDRLPLTRSYIYDPPRRGEATSLQAAE